jgi:hypothetical protein
LFLGGAKADLTATTSDAGTIAVPLDGEWQSVPDLKDVGQTEKWFDPAHFPASAAKPIQVPGSVPEVWANSTWTKDAAKDSIWYAKTFRPI